MTAAQPTRHELDLDGVTHGGEAVGRLDSGKVCFVPHAIPGERVVVEITEERSKWSRARLVEVVEASPDRVEPPCPYAGVDAPDGPARCGGCVLQHVSEPRQARMKQRIVAEQLTRIGRLTDPPVDEVVAVAPFGYRSHARFAADPAGNLGFRRLRSHEVVAIDRCLLLDDHAQALRDAAGDAWQGVEEVDVHATPQSRALTVHPGPGGMPPLPEGDAAVALVGAGKPVELRGDATVIEQVGEFAFQVSPTSFFQPGPQGAAVLSELVCDRAQVRSGDHVLDAYAGVGLFARALAAADVRVTAVEAHRTAARDARANLVGAPGVEVVRANVASFVAAAVRESRRFDVIVIDPPRKGAGTDTCRDLARLGARRLVYVSCDPAALARDARALVDAGLQLERATPVDQFAQTAAVETVAVFTPARDGGAR